MDVDIVLDGACVPVTLVCWDCGGGGERRCDCTGEPGVKPVVVECLVVGEDLFSKFIR